MSDNNSTDLSDSDNEFENTDNYIGDKIKTYQVQFVKDDYYKFTLIGLFKEIPSIELTHFDYEDGYCSINTNFTEVQQSSGICLYDMITMTVIKKDGRIFKVILSVEIDNPKLDTDNKGNLMIWLEYKDKRAPIKTELTHPGNEKIPYYIINELKNDKINKLIEEFDSQ